MRCAAAAGVALIVASTPAPAAAQLAGWLSDNFIDPEGGAFDLSGWVGGGGFVPVPLIVT